MKGANAQVTEWGFSDCGKTDAMSLRSGSSGSRGCMEKEESRHRHHLEWLESLVLSKLCVMINCIDSTDIKMIILILLRCRTGRKTLAGMGLRSLPRR